MIKPPPLPTHIIERWEKERVMRKKLSLLLKQDEFLDALDAVASDCLNSESIHVFPLSIGSVEFDLHMHREFTDQFLRTKYDEERLNELYIEYGGVKGFFDNLYNTIYISHHFGTYRYEMAFALYHEVCHTIQNTLYKDGEEDWYDHYENRTQDLLFKKYRKEFGKTYASVSPIEASAEVFRRLAGYKQDDLWENNETLLLEYKEFFKSQKVFKELPFI